MLVLWQGEARTFSRCSELSLIETVPLQTTPPQLPQRQSIRMSWALQAA
jgi:hypothetical protein